MNVENHYILVYYEKGHSPKYFLATLKSILYTNNSLDEIYKYALTNKKLNRFNIKTDLENDILSEIKTNIGYSNFPGIIKLSDLEKIINNPQYLNTI